ERAGYGHTFPAYGFVALSQPIDRLAHRLQNGQARGVHNIVFRAQLAPELAALSAQRFWCSHGCLSKFGKTARQTPRMDFGAISGLKLFLVSSGPPAPYGVSIRLPRGAGEFVG